MKEAAQVLDLLLPVVGEERRSKLELTSPPPPPPREVKILEEEDEEESQLGGLMLRERSGTTALERDSSKIPSKGIFFSL